MTNTDLIEAPDEAELVAEAIRELEASGRFNCAQAVEAMARREEARKTDWQCCPCGARRPSDIACPVCDSGAVMPCICREYTTWSKP